MKKALIIAIPVLLIALLGYVFLSKEPVEETKKTNVPGGTVTDFTINEKREANMELSNTSTSTSTSTDESMEKKDSAVEETTPDKVTQATLKTSMGDITVEFYGDDSPNTVNNFVKLAKEGFYNGIKFHRVIKDFMIQAGDPLSKDDSQKDFWGTGGPGYMFEDEFNNHPLVAGSFAMANAGPNTNGSQFFIVTADSTPWLDGKHTNFGQVTQGLDIVMAIQGVATEGADRPVEAVVIESIELQ